MTTYIKHTRAEVERQIAIEQEGVALGVARYNATRAMPWSEGTSQQRDESELPPGQAIVRLTTAPLAEAITEFVDRVVNKQGAGRTPDAAQFLFLMDAEAAAQIISRNMVHAAARQESLQQAGFRIARDLYHHVEMTALSKEASEIYKAIIRRSKKSGWTRQRADAYGDLMKGHGVRLERSREKMLQLGVRCIELACDSTGLFDVEVTSRDGRRPIHTIRPTEACRRWMEREHSRCAVMEPFLMPMIVRPKRWRSPFVGGYVTRRPGCKLVKRVPRKKLAELAEKHDMSRVYAAVNAIQDVPWQINERILQLMTEVWNAGGILGGIPPRDDEPLPPRPENMEDGSPELAAWKAEASKVYARRASALSGRLAFQQRLWVATKFAPERAIYFPHELDFRGRVYPMPVCGPHPQADDIGKALLQFAQGKPLGEMGAWWLAVHIANLWGVDKVSFDDRVKWTIANTEKIVDSAINPLDGERFWTQADSPWCALAAAMEYVGYLQEGFDYVSKIPIALDGSCSGLQHFSAMLRDPVGGAAVNLVPSDKPQDLYSQVAARAQEIVDLSDDPELAPWKGGKVSRKIAKRPCMTYCYSATRYGMVDMILQTLRELDADSRRETGQGYLGEADLYKAAAALSYVMWAAMGSTVSAAEEAMGWLKAIAAYAGKEGKPVQWVTPMGFPVVQDYKKMTDTRMRIHWRGTVLQPLISFDSGALDRVGQKNAIAPNFVHSMDASHLQTVALAARENGMDIALIHDSFGTHACDTESLSQILRDTFVDQYEGHDVLGDFLRTAIPEDFPESEDGPPPSPPQPGALDLGQTRRSRYVFA